MTAAMPDDAPYGIVVDAMSTGRHLPEALAAHGCRTIHLQTMPEILPHLVDRVAPADSVAETIVFDGDTDALVARLRPFAPRFCVPGTETEIGIALADTLAERLGLPGNGTALSAARRDKFAMGEALAAAGVRRIEQMLSADADAIVAWMADNAIAEAVIKPRDSAGTDCVHFCRTPDQVRRAVETIVGRRNILGFVNHEALAQRRIVGRQFTVNTVSIDGAAYLGECWTYETVEVAGAGSICVAETLLDGADPTTRRLGAYVRAVLDALGLANGPAHIELFEDADGPVLIELGARLQGSMSRPATLAALGHDHVSLTALRCADPDGFRAHVAANDPYRRQAEARVVSLMSDVAGTIVGHSGLDRIKALPTFADAIGFPPVGAAITPTRDLLSTPGMVYLVGTDPDQLDRDRAALQAMSMTEVFDLA
jgi:biotin carboxylase